MTVKKKATNAGGEKGSAKSLDKAAKREHGAKTREGALKKAKELAPSAEAIVNQIIDNPMVAEFTGTGHAIPLETTPISATKYEGLVEYEIKGTALRLVGLADPTQTPTDPQRVIMARRLVEVGPQLPKYVKGVKIAPVAFHSKNDPDNSEHKSRREEAVAEDRPKREKKTVATTSSTIVNGVPLKKLCAEIDLEPKDARAILRKAKVEKPGGRWEWTKEDAENIKAILVKGKEAL